MSDRTPPPTLTRRALLGAAACAAAGIAAGAGPPARAAAALHTRAIPSSGEPLPVVGLGTWRTFNVGTSPQARAPLIEVLRGLFAAGARVIDTAPMYVPAEQVLGELLTGMGAQEQAWLATKVWITGRAGGSAQMEESLRLLRRQRVELIQVHNLVDWRTQLATLREWKAAGRIRYLGLTHYTPAALDELATILEHEALDFVQVPYSLGLRVAERRLLPAAAERGVAVLVNQPFEEGHLFNRVRSKRLPPWAAEFGAASWAQFFLKYLLAHPAVTCVIPATAKPRHLQDNLGAGRGALPTAAQRRLMIEHWDSL